MKELNVINKIKCCIRLLYIYTIGIIIFPWVFLFIFFDVDSVEDLKEGLSWVYGYKEIIKYYKKREK